MKFMRQSFAPESLPATAVVHQPRAALDHFAEQRRFARFERRMGFVIYVGFFAALSFMVWIAWRVCR